ncbi:hypothetical protein ACHAW6_004559 [Cyclotella cf. meneghiniana]
MFLRAPCQRSVHIVRTVLQLQTKACSPLLCDETSPSPYNGTIRYSSCSPQTSVALIRNNSESDLDRLSLCYTPNNNRSHSPISQMNPNETAQNTPTFNDIDIEELHRQAIVDKQSTYIDPSTGFTVFTELAHLKRGKCCGNMCRHCPYGYSNVKGLDFREEGKVSSGDRVGTERLVKMILDGTYYENEGGVYSNGCSANGEKQSYPDNVVEAEDKSREYDLSVSSNARGKGGYAGGTLTSKNVPYTRKGDAGTSQLFTGERRNKDDLVFEAMGTVDELCSVVGTVYAKLVSSNKWIDTMTEQLPELKSFILPTGSPTSAQLHVARTVCRRAERRMVPLLRDHGSCDSAALAYVNRLSDYLFTAARYVNYCEGKDEVQYRRERGVSVDMASTGRERVVVRLKD